MWGPFWGPLFYHDLQLVDSKNLAARYKSLRRPSTDLLMAFVTAFLSYFFISHILNNL